jgi:chromosome segregation ATPase
MSFNDLLSALGLDDPKTVWGWILFLSSIGIEFIPKFHIKPWSLLIEWLGSKFNKKINDQIATQINGLKDDMTEKDNKLSSKVDELNAKVEEVHTSLQDHIKESEQKNLQDTRRDIQNFSNSCSNHVQHTKEEYDFYIHKCDEYETYIAVNKIKNGVIESAIRNIRHHYDKCIAENSFLVEQGYE